MGRGRRKEPTDRQTEKERERGEERKKQMERQSRCGLAVEVERVRSTLRRDAFYTLDLFRHQRMDPSILLITAPW